MHLPRKVFLMVSIVSIVGLLLWFQIGVVEAVLVSVPPYDEVTIDGVSEEADGDKNTGIMHARVTSPSVCWVCLRKVLHAVINGTMTIHSAYEIKGYLDVNFFDNVAGVELYVRVLDSDGHEIHYMELYSKEARNWGDISVDRPWTLMSYDVPIPSDGEYTVEAVLYVYAYDVGIGIAESDFFNEDYHAKVTMDIEFRSVDIIYDDVVNILDMSAVTKAWQTSVGDPRYNPHADMDGNGLINIDDVARVALDWGKTFSGTGGTGTPEISVHPNETEVHKYQTFSVDVTITDVTDLYGYQFQLYYNTTVLTCTSVDLPPDHFLTPINPDYIFIVKQEYNNTHNATHGRVWVAVTLMADEPGKNGNGTLATISFEAKDVGSTTLHFYDVVIGNSIPEAMPVIDVDGSVNVFPPASLTVLAEDQYGNSLTTGDVHIDGQWRGLTGSSFDIDTGTHEIFMSDFWDSVNIGYRYGFQHWEDGSTDNPRTLTVVEDTTIKAYFKKKWCPGDCNGDGIVNLSDLSIVSANWYKSVPPGDPRADLNGDDFVDLLDLSILSDNWFNQYPDP